MSDTLFDRFPLLILSRVIFGWLVLLWINGRSDR